MFTLYMLISHTISDFIFQSSDEVKLKRSMAFEGYIHHGMVLLLTLIPLLILVQQSSYQFLMFRVSLIILLHIFFDFIKEKTQNWINKKTYFCVGKAILFVCDQLAHIFIIIVLTNGIVIEYNKLNEWLLEVVFNGIGLTPVTMKMLFIVLYISFSGAYFIPLIFDIVYERVADYTGILNKLLKRDVCDEELSFIDEVKTGRWIGVLERILIIIFLYSNQISSIGFVIAVKSLARFKMMENKIFSEYYLLGTLFSVVYTFVLYAFFQKIL